MANILSFMGTGKSTGLQTKTQPNPTSKSSLLNFIGQGTAGGQQHLTQPVPEFKDTQQGQSYRNTFAQSDPATKNQIVLHLSAGAKAGNQKSLDQLNAIKDLVSAPTKNPVKMATSGSKLLDVAQNITRPVNDFGNEQFVKPVLRGGQALTNLQNKGNLGEPVRQFVGDALQTGLNFVPVGAATKVGLAGKLLEGAKLGTKLGAAQGAATAIGSAQNAKQAVEDIGVGALGGAALGAGGVAAVKGISKLGDVIGTAVKASRPLDNATKLNLVSALQKAGKTAEASAVNEVKTVGGVRSVLQHADNPEVKTVPIKNLTTYESAPEKGTILGYKNAIQDGNPIEPLKIKTEPNGTMGVEDGKHRLEAYKQLGYKEVPVQEVGTPKPSPIGTGAPTGISNPIGEGQVKTAKLASGVQQKAIENKLTTDLGDLPEYKQVNMKEQAQHATNLLTQDKQHAIDVALGNAAPPSHILPEAVFTAVEDKALKEGNVELLTQLAGSTRTTEATAMGQRIRALAERDPNSAVGAIKQVADARAKQSSGKAIGVEKSAIKKQIPKPTKETWESFIESIKC